jgi:hypothetical protein
VLISAQCGADGITIGHYDGSWMPCLRAIKQGLEEADIEVRGRDGRDRRDRTEPAPARVHEAAQ